MKFGGDFILGCGLMDKVQVGGDGGQGKFGCDRRLQTALSSAEALMVAIHQGCLCLLSLPGRAPPDAT